MNSNDNLNTIAHDAKKLDEPLVSIIVITYNSAKYVLETLESAKAQTYKNIELIISDDCSIDNTVEICRKWNKENNQRFSRTQLLVSQQNTGISANCNRGVSAAIGEWVKLIAGDDILLINCISENVNFALQNQDASLIFSRMEIIGGSTDNNVAVSQNEVPYFFSKTAHQQFNLLVIKNRLFAPSSFIKAKVIRDINGYDERIRNLEDRPLWIKATKAGYKLFFMPTITVKYRVHPESINYNFSADSLHDELVQIFYLYQLPNMSLRNILNIWHTFLSLQTLKNKKFRVLKIFSPIWYYQKISLTSLFNKP